MSLIIRPSMPLAFSSETGPSGNRPIPVEHRVNDQLTTQRPSPEWPAVQPAHRRGQIPDGTEALVFAMPVLSRDVPLTASLSLVGEASTSGHDAVVVVATGLTMPDAAEGAYPARKHQAHETFSGTTIPSSALGSPRADAPLSISPLKASPSWLATRLSPSPGDADTPLSDDRHRSVQQGEPVLTPGAAPLAATVPLRQPQHDAVHPPARTAPAMALAPPTAAAPAPSRGHFSYLFAWGGEHRVTGTLPPAGEPVTDERGVVASLITGSGQVMATVMAHAPLLRQVHLPAGMEERRPSGGPNEERGSGQRRHKEDAQ